MNSEVTTYVCTRCHRMIKWVWLDGTRMVGHYIYAESTSPDRGATCREETESTETGTLTRHFPHEAAYDLPADNANRDSLEAWLES